MTSANDEETKRLVLKAALADVPFDGWTGRVLQRAASNSGLAPIELRRLFPKGVPDLVTFYLDAADSEMRAALDAQDLAAMNIRTRIATAIRVRLQQAEARREVVRRTLAYQTLPGNALRALRSLYRTVDQIWRAAGDQATDFNFYTKRALLAGVYSSTLLYWLNDDTADCAATWEFLDRRIGDVMQIQRARGRIEKLGHRLPSPWRLLGGLRHGTLRRGA